MITEEQALREQFAKTEFKADAPTEFQAAPIVEKEKIENKANPPIADKLEDKVVLSNTDNKSTAAPEVKAEVKEIKVPSFEESITERSGGKYKGWDEIEAKLNKPEIKFANEQVQKINEFIENGGKIDEKWLYFQNTDFDKITDSFELLSEAMRLEEPDITDEEIDYRIKTEYKIDEWSEDEEPTEIEKIMSIKAGRDAKKARKALNDHKLKTSFAPNQKSEADIKKEAEFNDSAQKNWEKVVDESGFDKLSVKIDEKEVFDVIVSDDERKSLNAMVKQMGKDGINKVLVPKFIGPDGNIDVKKLSSYIFKAENYDNAVKAALTQGIAKGSHAIVKDIKVTNFNPDSKTQQVQNLTLSQQVGKQILQHK